jgi:hypothetical protein
MSATTLHEAARRPMPERVNRWGWILLALGVLVAAAAYALETERAYFSSIVLLLFVASLAGGSLFLVALEYIAGAVWSVPMRRVSEFLTGLVPLLPLLALPVLLQPGHVFHWAHHGATETDSLLAAKEPYLNTGFFTVRFVAVVLLWLLFAWLFVRNSTRQDTTGDPALTTWNIRLSAAFMPVFALSLTVLAVDWGMSLDPHWFSTIYGVYYFSGTVLAALAGATYVIVRFHETGYFSQLRRDHFYSLGALMFVFVNFWAYIAFSQFLLIWYADLPEETFWFIHRWEGGWEWFSMFLILVHFLVPYFVLLSQDAKMDPRRLKFMALWILGAHWVDLYWLVMPSFGKTLSFSPADLAVPLIVSGLVILMLAFKMKRHNLIPVGDPKLTRGLEFHL